MNLFKLFKKNLLLLIILVGIISCASRPVVHDFPPSASPLEEISNLETKLIKASDNDVDILSPKNFNEARTSLIEAKKKYRSGKDSQLTLHEVALGNAYLISAQSAADVARENAEDVIAARKAALRANAQSYFNKDFREADNDFIKLTKDIEKNKMSKVSKLRPKLQKKYLDLELKAIKEFNLSDSRKTIGLAKKEGAQKYAPRTLAIAEKSLLDTENYITANRHNLLEISNRSQQTRNDANHVLNINRTAKGMNRVSSEELALSIEKEKNRVAMKQGQLQSVEDKLQTTQSALSREKTALNLAEDKLQTTQSALEKEKKTKEELNKTKEELEALKKREERYEIARKTFKSNEAEVYKLGDAVLIRLKGIEFPSSKAIIETKNYPLLSKVQKVIEEFGTNSEVIIEGHTDSTGIKKINDRLSSQRAIAVKEYLKSIDNGIDKKIEAVGYGSEKPIAGNKTANGRAQNRRVDIIIKPESTNL